MNRLSVIITALAIATILVAGCSSGIGTGSNPVMEGVDQAITPDTETHIGNQSPQLWGYYDLFFDIESQTVEAIMNRDVMYAINIVNILNKHPASLGFSFNGTDPQPGYLDVSLDLSITHPFSSNPALNGYDVRGILICDGHGTMDYNSDLIYPENGTDQVILNADGYSRWFNKTEFTVPGLFGYKDGLAASGALIGNATLNPYKYFADDITAGEDAYAYLIAHGGMSGVFSSGTTNTRTYEIRFPLPTPGVQYGYAIVANWQGIEPSDHPSNAHEAVGCDVEIVDNVYYEDASTNGGNLILEFSLIGWDDLPSALFIESTVLSSAYELSGSEMTPIDSGALYATWAVTIPADNVTGTEEQEFWVVAEYDGHDYSCPFGIPNAAESDTLAACFRYDLFVLDEYTNNPPVITDGINGDTNVNPTDVDLYSITVEDPDGPTLNYMWQVFEHNDMYTLFYGSGDNEGNFTINWATDVGVSPGQQYDVFAMVTDTVNDGVWADKLVVTIN